MESISLEDRHDIVQDRNGWLDNSDQRGGRRLPTLRDSTRAAKWRSQTAAAVSPVQRFFGPLCVLQTVVIALMIIYLYWFHQEPPDQSSSSKYSPPSNLMNGPASSSGAATPVSLYRVYTNGTSGRARLLLEPVAGCNQRRHDLRYNSVICSSKNVKYCRVSSGIQENLRPNMETTTGERGVVDGSGYARAQVVTTSKAGKRLHSEWVSLDTQQELDCGEHCDTGPFDARTKILIDDLGEVGQSIIGWGGAMTDSSINNILSLSTNGTMQLLDDYFGPDGLQFNIVRITIGGSDFSARFYTNNDKLSAHEPDDISMSKFKLSPEDSLYKIPMLRYIQDRYGGSGGGDTGLQQQTTNDRHQNRIKLFASMWSPPTWMKTNNHFNKGQLKGSISMRRENNAEEESYYRALAELKKQFILAYQRNSIRFWGMTVMNEPVFAVQPFLDFNTMIFPKHDYADYIAKYLGPLLKEHPELGHIKLMAHDDNRRFLLDFMEPTLNRTESGRYIDGVSVHGYADKDYHQMETIYELNRASGLFVLPTELCSGHLPWMEKALAGNWHRGIHYALDIIHSLRHSAAGWVDWNMALDMEGGPGWLGGRLDSPVLVDKTRDLYHKSPMFYVLGQFSRHIPAGSVRLRSTLINGHYNYPLETVTFRPTAGPDGQTPAATVTVILNANPHAVTVYLKLRSAGHSYKISCDPDSVTTVGLASQ